MSVPASQVAGYSSGIAPVATSMGSPTSPLGGTSGNPATSSNVLSLNLGGVNVNYDMGASTSDQAAAAYSFLDNSFSADNALVGNTIMGSQNFISGFAAPIAAMATTQQNFNTQVLPSMFGTLNAQNYSIGSQAVQAEAGVAQASVAASSASAASAQSSAGGLCFITTAVCEARNEADDGPTLTKLRAFRDSYMQDNPTRQALVRHYYNTAPSIVKHLWERSDAREYLSSLFERFIAPACAAIDARDYDRAFVLYTHLVFAARQGV
jgi:hypothetical protein